MANPADNAAPAFGAMSSVVKDHVYLMVYGHIYTTPYLKTSGVVRRSATLLVGGGETTFSLRVGKRGGTYRAAAVRPMIKRGVHAENARLITVMVNPLHKHYPAFRKIRTPGFCELPREKFAPLDSALDAAYAGTLGASDASALYEEVIRIAVECFPPASPVDPRITAVCDLVRRDASVSPDELAAAVGLSYSRVSHLFSESMGISLRSYQLWLKVHNALMSLHRGRSLTEVARASGFTDLAHFSRTVQQAFGASITYFWDTAKVQIHYCAPELAELAEANERYTKPAT